MNEPSCSVVIPVRDRRRDVQQAVASVLSQTFSDFEVVVVDDGSTDGSGEAALESGDRRVRLVRLPGSGVSVARNAGVAQAKAPWVAFLDSDDIWLPKFLERTLELARSHPETGLIFTNCLSVRDERPWLDLPYGGPTLVEDYLEFLICNEGRGLQTSTTLVRRDTLRAVGGFPPGVARSEDTDTWLRLALHGPVGCVPEVLAEFHNEAVGKTRAIPQPCYPEPVNTLRRLRAQGLLNEERRSQALRLEALYLLIYARDLLDYGDAKRAREILRNEVDWRRSPPVSLSKAVVRAALGR